MRGQSIVEYTVLFVAVLLVAVAFIGRMRGGVFTKYFNKASTAIITNTGK